VIVGHDWEKYLACMEEVKKRIQILDEALLPFRARKELAVPNLELAALQLRKIYELIAFASLATNRERYSQVRQRYEKDWNLAEVLRIVAEINPHSFPVACRMVGEEIIDREEMNFTKSSLAKFHGELATLLHAKNPYKDEFDYLKWHQKCVEMRDHALDVLNFHRVWPDPDKVQTFYFVQMHTLPKGEIQVAVFEKIGKVGEFA
jgi:hypothetical protein